ncbi:MAG: hypothetical protein JWQ69_2619 [Pseudomonas sp.]|nr:hypothetical protein [Pseudomonas sp.]
MWKRRRCNSIDQDLAGAADDLRTAVDQLLDISVDLIRGGNEQGSQLIAGMIVSLQEDEQMLRKHANHLKAGKFGRRASD